MFVRWKSAPLRMHDVYLKSYSKQKLESQKFLLVEASRAGVTPEVLVVLTLSNLRKYCFILLTIHEQNRVNVRINI